ncbi:Xanthine dehydrogenase [Acorus calamus]|uniref:Xanthine dehydrogenase n=1 Tax=Acorus calamus TaxID=4465 RepID=A0AAV9CJ40_ACOCL|nr:Xanthine dehydrogenase [Acorus calamus]
MGALTAVGDGLDGGEDFADEIIVYVNGVRRVLSDGLAHMTLLQYLRDRRSLYKRSQGVPNPKAIHSSKAVGEPPLFLASSVFSQSRMQS